MGMTFRLSLAIALLAAFSPHLQASVFTVGNDPVGGNTGFSFYYQQGFSASVAGNIGSGTAPLSGDVYLTEIFVDYNSPQSGTLYLFESWFTGTPASMSSLTIGGSEGLIAKSSDVSGNTWTFDGVTLDVNSNYYFAADFQAAALISVNVNTYGDQTNQFLSGASTSDFTSGFSTVGDDDIAFRATFSNVPEPTSLATLGGLTALFGLGYLRRRKQTA